MKFNRISVPSNGLILLKIVYKNIWKITVVLIFCINKNLWCCTWREAWKHVTHKWTQNTPIKRPSQTILCVPVYKSFAIQRKENGQKPKQCVQSKVTAYTCLKSSSSFKLIYVTVIPWQLKCAYPLSSGVFQRVSCIFVHAAAVASALQVHWLSAVEVVWQVDGALFLPLGGDLP